MRKATLIVEGEKTHFSVANATDWSSVALALADTFSPGSVIAISGPLGAGKTTFVQALAHVMGIQRIPQSPTFALMRSYPIPRSSVFYQKFRRLIHVDAYRIEHERDFMALDLDEELADGKSILLLEWPEKVPGWLQRQQNVMHLNIET